MNPQQSANITYHTVDQLQAAHTRHGLTFLFRHAARYPLVTPEDVFVAGLTEQGVKEARLFGEMLRLDWKVVGVFSSPIQRCIDTGKLILEGADIETPIYLKWWLYSPNLQAEDGYTPPNRLLTLASNEYTMVLDKGKLKMVLERIKVPEKPGEINLYIAHDTTILPLLAFLLDLDVVPGEAVPGFLQGIALREVNGKLSLASPTR